MNIAKNGVKKKKRFGDEKSTMNLSSSTLDIFCKYIISDPSFVKISHVANLNSMIRNLDPSTYVNDPEKLKRIRFIQRGIEARLSYNLTDRGLVISHIISGIDFDIDFIDLNTSLTMDEVKWAQGVIEQGIKYGFVYKYADKFIDICTGVKTTDFEHRGNIIDMFKNLIHMTSTEFRQAEIDDNLVDMTFSLAGKEFDNAVTRTYEAITNPGRRLICGMQGLNAMIGGGFEEERVYVLLGITGVGKSITLLNLAYQLKKYNVNYKPKDPSKIPTIVYLTMENSVVETITRLFDMTTESRFGMGSYKLEEVMTKLKEEGQLVINDNSPINIVIKYKANRSVDTSYCYELYDNLLDQGMEMICLIQDHLLRIRSVFGNPEPRFELGDVVNEFKTFAAEKQISVITDFHLNRDAMKAVEGYMNSKRSRIDITQKLGKSNVSESVLILNNTDIAIIINKDTDLDGQEYMGFNLIKMRDKTNVFYFAQPFAFGNSIRLKEDLNGSPAYKTSLRGENDMGIANVRTSSANALGQVGMIVSNIPNNDNAFEDQNNYNIVSDDEDDIDIQDVKIIKPSVISPFDTMPVLEGVKVKQEETLAEVMADINQMKVSLDLQPKVVKPILFGEEAEEYFD